MTKPIIKAPKILDEHLPVNELGEKADLSLVDENLTVEEQERLRQAATIYRNSLSGAKQEFVADLDITFMYPTPVEVLTEKTPEPLSTAALNSFLGSRGHPSRTLMQTHRATEPDLSLDEMIAQVRNKPGLFRTHQIPMANGVELEEAPQTHYGKWAQEALDYFSYELRIVGNEIRVYGRGRDSVAVGAHIYSKGGRATVVGVIKGSVYNVIETD